MHSDEGGTRICVILAGTYNNDLPKVGRVLQQGPERVDISRPFLPLSPRPSILSIELPRYLNRKNRPA